jgi:DNA-binding transcriptional ArsR family regulator
VPVATSVGAEEDVLSITFGALSDPTRRAILGRLTEGDASVSELSALFPTITLQAVSKHLKVLERAGLVTRAQSARERPAHLRAEPIAEATAWLAHYGRFYEDSLGRLGEHLARVQRARPDSPSDPERS